MSFLLNIMVCAALAITVLDRPAQAQQQPPFATTKVDGTENVYVFRYGGAQAMFVVTKEGVIATDPIGYGRPPGGDHLLGRDQEGHESAGQVRDLQPSSFRPYSRR